ncbi:MAG: TIR domain-containing protein [Blastocatellia bacterium]
MKIFLSWSGNRSGAIAKLLYDWLPQVINYLDPYLSETDIEKGARWSVEVAKNLQKSRVGVLCLTPENTEAPWIMFEAGALSRDLEDAYVCPFIFDLEAGEIKGPLSQFQVTRANKEDVRKLVFTMNRALARRKRPEPQLDSAFEVWWPKLEEGLARIAADPRYKQGARYKQMQRPQNLVETYEKEVRQYAKSFKAALLDRYGFKAASSTALVEILDLDGTSRFSRSWQGIKVTSGITVAHIPGEVATSSPESKFIKKPELVKSSKPGRRLTLIPRTTTSNKCEFYVRIAGALKKGDPKLSYQYESTLTKGFLMSRKEVLEAYKDSAFRNEYFAAQSEIPSDKLIVEIIFPRGYKVRLSPGVFMGRSEFLHDSELQRVISGFRETRRGARFEVKEPLIGFSYLIYWLPPPPAPEQ